jgi:hypothetical protein
MLLAHGCAQSTIRTILHRDGTWTREDTFSQASLGEGWEPSKKLSDIFVLPQGRGWKIRRGGDQEVEHKATRILRAGAALRRDVVVREKDTRLWNEASVRQIRPGVWQYREVLHWAGPKPTPRSARKREFRELIRLFQRALPARLATAGNARELAQTTERIAAKMLVGPPRPLLMEALTSPELAVYHFSLRLGQEVDRALRRKFGARISNAERYSTVRQVVASARSAVEHEGRSYSESMKSQMAGAKGASRNTDRSFSNVTMTFVLRVPGRILETNGEVNPYTGEILWALYPEAVAAGDVVLLATTKISMP